MEVDCLRSALKVALYLHPQRVQAGLQLLAQELQKKVAREEDLVVGERVGVVLTALPVRLQ